MRSLERRLENLERLVEGRVEDLKVALCPKLRKGPITWSERRLMPDGSVQVSGERPPPLCDACPERDNPNPLIRHIEVRHGFPWEETFGRSWTSKAKSAKPPPYSGPSTMTR